MKREIRYAASGLRPRAVAALLAWSALEVLPTALFGLMLARAVDEGFLAGRPWTGAAWLGGVLVAAIVGALGAGRVYAVLGAVVEPFRDRLVRRVVHRSLHRAVAGRPEIGALSLLTRQVEIARDAYAGIVVSVRGCLVTTVGVGAGLLALDPRLALLVLPPFFLGLFAFAATLGFAAGRQRDAADADADLTDRAGQVAAAARDLAACGGESQGEALAAEPIAALAKAERALAAAAALRTLCFAVGGWLPLLILLAAATWLLDRGVTAGALTGALLYVLTGLQPALASLISGLGTSGLRLYIALTRILPALSHPESTIEPGATPNQNTTHLDRPRTPDPTASSDPQGTIETGAPDNPTPARIHASQAAGPAEPPGRQVSPEAETAPKPSNGHLRLRPKVSDLSSKIAAGSPPGTRVESSGLADSDRSTSASAAGRPVGPRSAPAPVLAAHGLTFAYGPHSAPAVEDLELAIRAGDHLAVVGPSGIGKSTLAALLCGLIRPDRGTVAYAGADAARLSPRALARRRVLLPQGGYVFTGTVRANLAYLDPTAADEAITAAAAAVGADGLVDRLGGLGAAVEPRSLSNGERQLLALARAYLSPAPLAILDEATCHLDPAAEERAERAFAERGTLVVIAHRPSSAMRAERVLVLDGGTAVQGDRELLQGISPLFRELVAQGSGTPAATS